MMKPNNHEQLACLIEDHPKTESNGDANRSLDKANIGENDVLCGRGGLTNSHTGNIRFREIVADNQIDYLKAKKRDKIIIANQIVALIHEMGGRFLRKTPEGWVPITDKKAQEKTSQALREGLDVRNKKIRPNKQIRRDDEARGRRRVADGKVLAGFAGATADAFTLFERLEAKLEQYSGQLLRAAVELAKDWRTDKYLRNLEALMIVADDETLLVLTGNGDVLEPEAGIAAIGSGGNYALAAARALADYEDDAEMIARKAMAVAADICVFTNGEVTLETV